jgi:opacity protein-like surface antigen
MKMPMAMTALACSLAAGGAFAEDPPPVDRFLWGGALQVGDPVGSFGDAADTGVGALIHGTMRTRSGVFGWRLEGGWLVYGSESLGVPVPGTQGRVTTDVAFTENSIGHAVTGPVLMRPHGSFRPYATAFAGVSYFETATEFRPLPLGPAFARDTHFDDTVFTYGASAGVLFPLGRSGMALDLGARYAWNQDARYLTEGDLRQTAGGELFFVPHRSDADVLDFRIGLTFGR